MADRELSNKLSSGEITQIKVGGTAAADILKTKGENDLLYQDLLGVNAIVKTKYTPQSTPPSHLEGQMFYDETSETMRIQGPFSGVSVALGHGMHIHVENNSGALIEKGMAVRQSGVVDGKVQIVKALADTFLHARMFGVVSADIADGTEGAVTTFGEITDLDTSALPTGVPLYLSDTVAGTYTSTAPDIISRVGGALTAVASGVLFVSIINNKNTPAVFGGMQGQVDNGLGVGVYDLTTTAQDIGDYDTSSTVVVTVDKSTGEITLPNDGGYRMHFTAAISFSSISSTRSITVELYDVTGTTIHFSYVKNIPRDATEDSLSFSWPIDEITDNVHKMRIKASTTMTVTFDDVSFDIESISITA